MAEEETWNMATETMKRLSFLLNQSIDYFQDKKFIELYEVLLNLRRNIAPFLEDNEFEKLNNLFLKLPKVNWSSKENGKLIPEQAEIVIPLFDEIYILSGRYLKKKGLLMPPTINKGKSILGM